MKKVGIFFGILCFLIITLPVFAAKPEKAKGPHQKATGDVVAYTGSTRIDLTFNAHETDPVKGDISYSNSTGKYFLGNVDVCYYQNDNKAVFAGNIMEGTYSQDYFIIDVIDNGEGDKATAPDAIRVRVVNTLPDCNTISTSFPGIVGEGNLHVHKILNNISEISLESLPAIEENCTQIKDGVLMYSSGHYLEEELLSVGYDIFGYNYQAHLFIGNYANAYLGRDGLPPYEGNDEVYLADNPSAESAWYWPYRTTWILMKWNDPWLSNKDCDGDGLLDRHYGYSNYIGSGAWETNHMWDSYKDDGEMYNWNYFTKIVAAPSDAYIDEGAWYTADGKEIGPVLWGEFATILEIYNDQGTGDHGVLYKSPVGPGFGKF